ncbi:phage head completion protein [Nocardia acidivorans]|uniref:phage head completion protein n=1 Tax=Nocardia acidivorans TaxID=404580 RepID=UPI00083374FB|nr:head-tail adaptor protein [Nocardia acidivorans]
MSEIVIRHRGGGFDDDGNPVPASDVELVAAAVAPAAAPAYLDRGRNGAKVSVSVYFRPAVDLTRNDELTVDGVRYRIEVQQWKPRRGGACRAGTLALCSTGEG